MRHEHSAILDCIRGGKLFLITSHINPDGDSVASQLGLRCLLTSLGKEAVIVNRDPVPRVYRFLPGARKILTRRRHSLRPYDALFVLDCGNPSRASGFLDRKPALPVVNIDHHVTNPRFGDLNWVDVKASSTCEIVYDLARRLGARFDHDLAANLYAGILTDTGSFRYSSTTPRAMSVAGRLLRHGVDPHDLAERIYENAEYPSLRLLGKVLSRMGRSEDGRVSWVTFSYAELSSLSNMSETEEFVNYARSLNTARIAIGFKEVGPGDVRISFRSKGDINVAELASRYGGGGHRNAAGCSVSGSLRGVVKKVVTAAGIFATETEEAPRNP
jgi:phosphoesterase RecJ-like protein